MDMVEHSLLDQLYERAHEIFELAGAAVDHRDVEAHTRLYEEHRMISEAIQNILQGATLQ